MTSTVLVAATTERRCKICRDANRVDVDRLLIMRSRRESDDEGNRVNLEYIQAYALAKWGLELTKENIVVHFKKHVKYQENLDKVARRVGRESDKMMKTAVLQEVARGISNDDVLKEIIVSGLENMRSASGATVSVDHVLKAIDMQMKKSTSAAMDALVDAAAQAVGVCVDVVRDKTAPTVEMEIVDDGEDA